MFWKLLLRFNLECYRTVFLEVYVLTLNLFAPTTVGARINP